MLEQARLLNPVIPFREGNLLRLDLPDQSFAGITAFYAIANILIIEYQTIYIKDADLVIERIVER